MNLNDLLEDLKMIYESPFNEVEMGEGLFKHKIKKLSIDVINKDKYSNPTNASGVFDKLYIKNQLTEESYYICIHNLVNYYLDLSNRRLIFKLNDNSQININL